MLPSRYSILLLLLLNAAVDRIRSPGLSVNNNLDIGYLRLGSFDKTKSVTIVVTQPRLALD